MSEKKVDLTMKKEDGYRTLEMINGWISNVDTKISFALAFVGVVLGFLLSKGVSSAYTKILTKNIISSITCCEITSALIVTALYVSSLLCIFYLIKGIKAKVKNTESNEKSIFFFGSISGYNLNDYKSRFKEIDEKYVLENIIEQIHTNSKICTEKFKNYNKAIGWLLITSFLIVVCCIFGLI